MAVGAAVGTALGAVVGVAVGVDTAAGAAVGPPNLPIPLAGRYGYCLVCRSFQSRRPPHRSSSTDVCRGRFARPPMLCGITSCGPLFFRSVLQGKLLSRGSCASLAREAARAISGPPGGGELTSIMQRSLARFARQFFRSETVHIGFRMILEVSGIGSLEIGVVQVWIQRFQALEGALRKPCAVIFR